MGIYKYYPAIFRMNDRDSHRRVDTLYGQKAHLSWPFPPLLIPASDIQVSPRYRLKKFIDPKKKKKKGVSLFLEF